MVVGDAAPAVVPVATDTGATEGGGSAAGALVPVESDAAVTGGADVDDDPEPLASDGCEPPEHAVPPRARISNRTRRFTVAHHRAPAQMPLSTSAMSSPIWDGLRPTRQPAFSSASILAAAVPFDPETMAPAWPIFFPGGAVTPAT